MVLLNPWSTADGRPLRLDGIWDGARVVPLPGGLYDPSEPAPGGGTRVARYFPFASTAPTNVSLGSGATYESASDTQTAAFLAGSPYVNHLNWSVSVNHSDIEDPLATVKDPTTATLYATCRIPVGSPIPGGTDKWFTIVQPDGRTLIECYNIARTDDTHWTSPYVATNDLHGTGLTAGTRASGVSLLMGLIRRADLDQGEIAHTLALNIPGSMLKAGYVWPARDQDGDTSGYLGPVPMGSMFAIPPSVDITTLGLSADGLIVARALQDYGAHVLAQGTTVALLAEMSCDSTRVDALRDAWMNTLYPLMRRVTNNTAGNIGGGGTRRRDPLPDLAN